MGTALLDRTVTNNMISDQFTCSGRWFDLTIRHFSAAFFVDGILVDEVFEPIMAMQNNKLLTWLFGSGKGSGCALFFLVLAFIGVGVCLYFTNNKHIKALAEDLQE